MRLDVQPSPFLGGPASDYVVEFSRNGLGLISRHMPSGRAVPHVLGLDAIGSANGAPLAQVSRLLTFANPIVGVLNLGVGLFNGYQLHKVRGDVRVLTAAVASAAEEQYRLSVAMIEQIAHTQMGIAALHDAQDRGFQAIGSLIEDATVQRRYDEVAVRMREMELARRQLQDRPAEPEARELRAVARGARSWLDQLERHAATPMQHLPIVLGQVQALSADVDATIVLEAHYPGEYSRQISDARLMALELLRRARRGCHANRLLDNLDEASGIWLPDAYMAAEQSLIGASLVGDGGRIVVGEVIPTNGVVAELVHALEEGVDVPADSPAWDSGRSLEDLWAVHDMSYALVAHEVRNDDGTGRLSSVRIRPAHGSAVIPTAGEVARAVGHVGDGLSPSAAAASLRLLSTSKKYEESLPADVSDGLNNGQLLYASVITLQPFVTPERRLFESFAQLVVKPAKQPAAMPAHDGLRPFHGTTLVAENLTEALVRAREDAAAVVAPEDEVLLDLDFKIAVSRLAHQREDDAALVDVAEQAKDRWTRSGLAMWGWIAAEAAAGVGAQGLRPDVSAAWAAAVVNQDEVLFEIKETLRQHELSERDDRTCETGAYDGWLTDRLGLLGLLIATDTNLDAVLGARRRLAAPWGQLYKRLAKTSVHNGTVEELAAECLGRLTGEHGRLLVEAVRHVRGLRAL